MQIDHPFDIGWFDLATAAALLLIVLALSAWQRLGLGRQVVVGAVRATVQLVLIGHVLLWIFEVDSPLLVIAMLVFMSVVAAITATRRQSAGLRDRRTLAPILGLAIISGAVFTLTYVSVAVVHVTPWYSPRYLIPLFGMIVANAMNGAAIAAERLQSEMDARRGEIEAFLALGATPARACAEATRKALTAAMIPAVNALAIVGIVSLPGMMTGQILAGTSPALAVRYQLVVMFMLTAATAITAAITVLLYRHSFFTAAEQLLPRAKIS